MDPDEIRSQVEELRVLEQELASLKKNAMVYQKHGCSTVFFLEDRAKVHSKVKLELDQLSSKNDPPK